jgi:hypothetical protein
MRKHLWVSYPNAYCYVYSDTHGHVYSYGNSHVCSYCDPYG